MNDSKNPEGLTTMADAKASNGGSKREKGDWTLTTIFHQ
jgi:hypothetical protein